MNLQYIAPFAALLTFLTGVPLAAPAQADASPPAAQDYTQVSYHTVKVDGLNIFYREAGPKDAPTILLLHGFPSSSRMFTSRSLSGCPANTIWSRPITPDLVTATIPTRSDSLTPSIIWQS